MRSLLLAFGFALTACPTPMLHPLRASNGPNANVAITAMVANGATAFAVSVVAIQLTSRFNRQ